jgi:putative endonuclease
MWYVYIINCTKDNTLYTGITNNLEKRIAAHNNGTGARYTKGRGPVEVIKIFEVENRSAALKLECEIKKMKREDKLKL